MKRRNPNVGGVRIAQQIHFVFDFDIDQDGVPRVLAQPYRPGRSGFDGLSWLTFLAQAKDRLWRLDRFRCESIQLPRYGVLVVIEVFSRRLVGFGVERVPIDGLSVCRMLNRVIVGETLPKRLSTDPDALFRFHRWLANRRVLEIDQIQTVPYVRVSQPFVERMMGTIRRDDLDRVVFWKSADLARKWAGFQDDYNAHRVHQGIAGVTPALRAGENRPAHAALKQ